MDTLYSIDEIYVKKPNTLCIKGWIIKQAKDDSITVNVNNGKFKKEIISTVSRPDVLQKFSSEEGILERLLGFDIKFVVNTNINNIKIMENHKTEIRILKEYDKNEISNFKIKDPIISNIDFAGYEDNILKIRGWAFSKQGEKLDIRCENAKIDTNLRPDVPKAYKTYRVNMDCGFEISLKKGRFKFPVDILLKTSNSKKTLTVTKSMVEKKDSSAFSYIMKNLSLENIKKGLSYINKNGFSAFWLKLNSNGENIDLYREYLKKHRLTDEEKKAQRDEKFDYMPLISVVVPAYNTPPDFIEDMVESVMNQTYKNVQLCIADASNNITSTEKFKIYSRRYENVQLKILGKNYGISKNTNEAIKIAKGEFVALLDHDDILCENAMYEVVKALNKNKNLDFIYSDEDKIDKDIYYDPHFKSDYAPDTLRSYNCISHLSVIRKSIFEKVGYFKEEFDGSQDYDMVLRIFDFTKNIYHIPKILYHWRVHKNSVALNKDSKPYAYEAAKKALAEHLKRNGLKGRVEDSFTLGIYNIKYEIKDNPKVNIIIPNKDNKEMLEKCINSIKEKTSYKNYRITVVENNSRDKDVFDYYKKLEEENTATVEYYLEEFNYSRINNFAVKKTKADYLLFLNNDIEIINSDWIENMLMYAQRKDVAAVGAKLLYPNDTVQHAGVIIGLGGIAGHINLGLSKDDPGYFARASIVQNLSAVTGACLMMRKSVFDEIGGFDENLPVAFNDIDLCLKARKKDYLVVFTPNSLCYHYESRTRGRDDTPAKAGRFKKEQEYFRKKWGDYRDPYYNDNFSLSKNDYSIKI